MRMCAELADLGMDLARAAAAKTLADWAEPEEPATEAAPDAPEATRPAPGAKPPRAAGTAARAAKPADPATIFTRLVVTVRDCITLEARLADGPATAKRGTDPALRNDPRRAPLRDIFRRVTENHPDRAELVRDTTARIDHDLAADPDRTLELSTLFFSICEDLGIEVDLAILPDEFLGVADDLDDLDEADTSAPFPRATPPP
jgi:hypothetical protein